MDLPHRIVTGNETVHHFHLEGDLVVLRILKHLPPFLKGGKYVEGIYALINYFIYSSIYLIVIENLFCVRYCCRT